MCSKYLKKKKNKDFSHTSGIELNHKELTDFWQEIINLHIAQHFTIETNLHRH